MLYILLFDVFKSSALSGQISGDVRMDPQSSFFCLMLSCTSKCCFLVLKFVKTDNQWAKRLTFLWFWYLYL